jgi:hypothetical protein
VSGRNVTGAAARLAVTAWLAGAVVIATTWWDSGDQASSATQLPGVLVALGAGLGLVALGSALWGLDRARARAHRTQQGWAGVAGRVEGRTR